MKLTSNSRLHQSFVQCSFKFGLLATLLLSTVGTGRHAQADNVDRPELAAALFESDLQHPLPTLAALKVLREEGLDHYLRYWRANPQAGTQMRAWCAQQRALNGGDVIFDFVTHSKGTEVIDALNKLNNAMGFDCYRVRAKIDDSMLRSPETPTPAKAPLYKRVENARSVIQPLLGFGITLIPLGFALHNHADLSVITAHGNILVTALMKGLLEGQFARFQAWWTIPFSWKKFPMIPAAQNQLDADLELISIDSPELEAQSQNYLARSRETFRQIANSQLQRINNVLDRTGNRIRASHLLIAAINMAIYPGLMGASMYVGGHTIGPQSYPGFFSLILGTVGAVGYYIVAQAPTSAAFNFTITPYQDGSSAARNKGMIDESPRMFVDGALTIVLNIFRGISAMFENLIMPMTATQLAVGGTVSSILMLKTHGALEYAKQTGKQLDQIDVEFNADETTALKAAETILADSDPSAPVSPELAASLKEFQSTSVVKRFASAMAKTAGHHCDRLLNDFKFDLKSLSAFTFDKLRYGFKTDLLKKAPQPLLEH